MFLHEHIFKVVIASAPLVAIDLLVTNSSGSYLLGMRLNRPAQGFWFVPGGRIRKGESMAKAFQRIARAELGCSVEFEHARFLGCYEHFYNDSVFSDEESTHYIVMGYQITLELDLADVPKVQHAQLKWMNRDTLLGSDQVHFYSKQYVQDESFRRVVPALG